MKWVAVLRMSGVALTLCCMATGCNMFDSHIKQEDLLRGMASDASMRLKDGSISQMQVSGQGLNPGVTVEAALVYKATAKYEGIAGQFAAASQGTLGDRVTSEQILAIINDKSITDSQRWDRILSLYDRISTSETTTPTATVSTSTGSQPSSTTDE